MAGLRRANHHNDFPPDPLGGDLQFLYGFRHDETNSHSTKSPQSTHPFGTPISSEDNLLLTKRGIVPYPSCVYAVGANRIMRAKPETDRHAVPLRLLAVSRDPEARILYV
jgi:hypothetical protein